MSKKATRRQFIKNATVAGAAALASAEGAMAGKDTQPLPTIKLGKLEVSRLILGSNPFFGFAHKPGDVGKQMKQFYTEERIMAVMDEAAGHGITAVWTPCYDHWIRLWDRYQERGGKLKIWIGQPDAQPDKMKAAITACAKHGGKAVCIQGVAIDRQMRERKLDAIRGWLEHIKSLGLPAGMATHRPTTHLEAEEKGLPTDFYHQCLYQPENYSPKCREQALATVRKLDKPIVVYKALAAGRLDPAKAIPFLARHLRRKDGLCLGVFPKDQADQIAQNAALVRGLTA